MNGWIKINEHRFEISRIVGYKFVLPPIKELSIGYFDGITVVNFDIKYQAEHHTKRLDQIFNVERSHNAKVPATDTRKPASASR